jgi:hypothetical protein
MDEPMLDPSSLCCDHVLVRGRCLVGVFSMSRKIVSEPAEIGCAGWSNENLEYWSRVHKSERSLLQLLTVVQLFASRGLPLVLVLHTLRFYEQSSVNVRNRENS